MAKAKAATQDDVINPAAAADTAADTQGQAADAAVAPVIDPVAAEPKSVEMVKALVLLDCVYGKCGEVAEFDASQAKDIEAAGYIDTHPNAVASAG